MQKKTWQDKILENLNSKGAMTVKEIAIDLNHDENAIRVFVNKLREKKAIKLVGYEPGSGRAKRWEAIMNFNSHENGVNKELVKCLDFFNNLFMDNVEFLMQNEKILETVLNEEQITNLTRDLLEKYKK